MQRDGIWEIPNSEHINLNQSGDPRKPDLIEADVKAGLTSEIYNRIETDPQIFTSIIEAILESHFPSSLHQDILDAVGLDISFSWQRKKKRDPKFREYVLKAYEYQCAVCGFDVQLRGKPIALEAAHIKWHQAGGPDIENNGIALCTMHHKLFDKGAFTFNSDFTFHVSEYIHGEKGLNEWLMNYHGNTIKRPQRPTYFPEKSYLNWHMREVFKGPSRYLKDSEI